MCNPNHAAAANAKSSSSSTATLSKMETPTGGAMLKSITKSELAAHASPSSAWVALHESSSSSSPRVGGPTNTTRHIVLDITSFASTHPGGDLILLASGKDATVLFESYHPRGVPPSLIKKLTIGVMEPNSFTSFYSWHSEFYSVLKKRVIHRLESRKLQRRGSIEIWIKAALLLVGFWYSLYKMYTTNSSSTSTSFLTAAAWSISMGTFAALIGTNIQHDGNHGAFSNTKLINKLAGWTMDMIGASAYTWEIQHMLGHHPYTNLLDVVEEERKGRNVDCKIEEKDQESDPDVFSSFPLMRMHPAHDPSWFHRYQHIYAPLLFGAMTLAKVFQQDFEVFFHKRLYHIDANVRYGSMNNVLRFWCMKFISMIYMVGLPIYFHGVGRGMALFVIGHFACGELLATMFIVNHVIEGVSYAKKDLKGGEATNTSKMVDNDGTSAKVGKPTTIGGDTPMDKTRQLAYERISSSSGNEKKKATVVPAVPFNDWAAVQCQTSVNWAPGSWFWNHFSGGLSHQIEHHLFPSLCHTNHAYIQDVVEKTCVEYGVPYQSEPSLWVAYGKMIRHLKCLGTTKID